MVQKWSSYNLEFEIILQLIENKTHVRALAKQLNQSHTTVLRKLNRLISENVVDNRLEGKNKVFFIRNNLQAQSYIFNAEKYKLIKFIHTYPKIGIIIEDILKESKENLVILFGSYAKFLAKKDSDIDIYLETTNRRVKQKIKTLNSKIQIKIGEFDTESLLIKEIIKNHIILRGVESFYEKTKFFK